MKQVNFLIVSVRIYLGNISLCLTFLSPDSITDGSFFYVDVLKQGDVDNPTFEMNGSMVLSLLVLWVLVYLTIFNGVETAGNTLVTL